MDHRCYEWCFCVFGRSFWRMKPAHERKQFELVLQNVSCPLCSGLERLKFISPIQCFQARYLLWFAWGFCSWLWKMRHTQKTERSTESVQDACRHRISFHSIAIGVHLFLNHGLDMKLCDILLVYFDPLVL